MPSTILPWLRKQHQTARLFQGRGPAELSCVEEGKVLDFSLSIAWTAKPGPVSSKT
jgi:hypothetical protein